MDPRAITRGGIVRGSVGTAVVLALAYVWAPDWKAWLKVAVLTVILAAGYVWHRMPERG